MLRVGNRVRVNALVVAMIGGSIVTGCGGGVSSTPPSSAPPAAATSPSVASAAPSLPSPAAQDPAPGTARTDEHGVEQVWVPAGVFLMGTDETDPSGALAPPDWARFELAAERPQHEVALSKGYWIDKTEVTNVAYQAFVDDGGYATATWWSEDGQAWLADQDVNALPRTCGEPGADHPRVCITWFEAEAYAAWRGGALPTEAQWEFAARGPESSVFPWGTTGSGERQRRRLDRHDAGRKPAGRRELGRGARHVRQRHGVGTGLVHRHVLPAARPRRSAGFAAGSKRSRRAVGGAPCRMSPGPPIATSRTRPPTRTTTSGYGSSAPSDRSPKTANVPFGPGRCVAAALLMGAASA